MGFSSPWIVPSYSQISVGVPEQQCGSFYSQTEPVVSPAKNESNTTLDSLRLSMLFPSKPKHSFEMGLLPDEELIRNPA